MRSLEFGIEIMCLPNGVNMAEPNDDKATYVPSPGSAQSLVLTVVNTANHSTNQPCNNSSP